MHGELNDPYPFVFGETKGELLKRIQFSGRGSKKAKGVQRTLPGEMREATLSSCGDFASFTRTAKFLENAFSYPSTVEDIWISYYSTLRLISDSSEWRVAGQILYYLDCLESRRMCQAHCSSHVLVPMEKKGAFFFFPDNKMLYLRGLKID